MQKIDLKSLTKNDVEIELKREERKQRYLKILKSTFLTLIVVISIATLISTLIMPVLQISGNSMEPTFNDGDIVAAFKKNDYEVGDIIAFYHGNKILVKRVIGKSGDWINISENGDIFINDNLLDEKYIDKKSYGNTNIDLPYQVPDNKYFVLGDDREHSIDSRNTEVGAVSKNDVVGKIRIRVWPLIK